MQKILKFIPILLLLVLTPLSASAASLTDTIAKIQELLNALLPLLISLGVIYLVWGIVQYFIGGGEEAKKKGRDRIIYGIIGLVIIISLWGLVYLVASTLGITTIDKEGGKAPVVTDYTPAPGSECAIANSKLQSYLGYFVCIINNSLIPAIFALAVLVFLWGAVQFMILHGGEEAKRTQGKQFMIWGIIAFVVMLGMWSLVKIIGGTFNLNTSVLPQVCPGGEKCK